MKDWIFPQDSTPSIQFDRFIQSKSLNANSIKCWIKSVISFYDAHLGELNYTFCNNEEIQEVNNTYLSHDYPTDIITFPLENSKISADIIISTEMVKSNAKDFNVSYESELLRVIIHGVLHLIGFDDDTDNAKINMRKAEENALKMWFKH